MSIKKSYIEIVEFLQANEGKKVSTIMSEVLLMAESKKQSSTFIADENGTILAIYCYYHKQWEIVEEVPYGSKANSTTGLNTMCKVGTSKWTKKQRDAKVAKAELLERVSNGDIQPSDIKDYQEDIESQRLTMDVDDMPHGYQDEDAVKAVLFN